MPPTMTAYALRDGEDTILIGGEPDSATVAQGIAVLIADSDRRPDAARLRSTSRMPL